MSQHRRAVARPAATPLTHRRRLMIGAVGALGASGLILGGIGAPVSADDVNVAGTMDASVEVRNGCVTAVAGTAGVDGSASPTHVTDAAALDAAGTGTATVTICGDDLDGPPPDDPGVGLPIDPDGIGPGDLEEVDPGDLDDVVPDGPGGSLEGRVVGVVTAALNDEPPGDGGGPLPGGLDGIVPEEPGDPTGGLGGLVPDGPGIDPGSLLETLGEAISRPSSGSGPGGHGGSGPGSHGGGPAALDPSTTGSVSGPVAAGDTPGDGIGSTDAVFGAEVGAGVPALGDRGATLPRTGGGLESGPLRLVALLGVGRALVGLAKRR